jgi:putative transposase
VCRAFAISETCYRCQPKLSDENAEIAHWLLRLTQTYKRWRYGLCFIYFRNIKGYGWNHKRVYRTYRELELKLKIESMRRIERDRPDKLSEPVVINHV